MVISKTYSKGLEGPMHGSPGVPERKLHKSMAIRRDCKGYVRRMQVYRGGMPQ